MASSEPTPTKRLAGVMVFEVWVWVLRRLQRSCLRSFWWLKSASSVGRWACQNRTMLHEGAVHLRIWVSMQAVEINVDS